MVHERVHASTLERALSRRLAVAEYDEDEDEDEETVVQFLPRYDAHWLHCTPPVINNTNTSTSTMVMSTLLGIFEDEGDEDAELDATLYQPTTTPTTTTGAQLKSCTCQAPHSDWKRRRRRRPSQLEPIHE
jgi:hypothetical protein